MLLFPRSRYQLVKMPRHIGNEEGNRVPLNKGNLLEHMYQYFAKELRPLSLHTTHIIYYAMKSNHYSLTSGFAKSNGGYSLNAQKATVYHQAAAWGTRFVLMSIPNACSLAYRAHPCLPTQLRRDFKIHYLLLQVPELPRDIHAAPGGQVSPQVWRRFSAVHRHNVQSAQVLLACVPAVHHIEQEHGHDVTAGEEEDTRVGTLALVGGD